MVDSSESVKLPPVRMEEVILYLTPNVFAILEAQSAETGESIGQIVTDMVQETLRCWD